MLTMAMGVVLWVVAALVALMVAVAVTEGAVIAVVVSMMWHEVLLLTDISRYIVSQGWC